MSGSIAGGGFGCGRGGQRRYAHRLSRRQPRRGFGAVAVDAHLAGAAQLLDRALRQAGKVPAEPAVQADVRFIVGDCAGAATVISPSPCGRGLGGGGGRHRATYPGLRARYNGIASSVSILSLSSTTIAR